jgi:hypothetical protein
MTESELASVRARLERQNRGMKQAGLTMGVAARAVFMKARKV